MNTITKETILERLNRFKERVDELGGNYQQNSLQGSANGKSIPRVFDNECHPNRMCSGEDWQWEAYETIVQRH